MSKPRRKLVRRSIALALSATVIGVTFVYVLPRIASYGAVWRVISTLSWGWLLALSLATVANIITFAPPWMVALPGLGLLRALSMTQVSTAFSLLVPGGAPVGMAASFAALRSWGFAGRPVGLAVTLTGIWNQLSVFVFPVIAVGLLTLEGGGTGNLALVAITGVAIFVVVTAAIAALLARPRLAYLTGERAAAVVASVGRLFRRPPPSWGGEALVRFRAETLELLRRRWISLTVATLANQLTGYVMLEVAVRAVGIGQTQVSVAECFAAWSIGRLLVSLPLTPGGIGFVELGLTGTLIGFGGGAAKVVAGVLLYRVASIAPTLLLGLLAAATWRLYRRTPTVRPPGEVAVPE